MTNNSRISNEKIKEIISRSGYLEEQKVILEFERLGFYAGANYAFEDQEEQKSREIDFNAARFTDFTFGKTGFYFFVYGEVKKRTNPLIFFERKLPKIGSLEVFIPIAATQEFFSNIDPFLDIKKILRFSEIHHQAKPDFISTQFCEIDKNKAGHKNLYESLFIPLLKCINSGVATIQKMTSFFNPDDPMYFLNVLQPVIIVSGPLYSYNVNDDTLIKKDYILYRRHYASKSIESTLLIDIITKDYLSEYISEKLLKTYKAIEVSLREQMNQIIEYCIKDRFILNQKVNEMLRKQGLR